MFGIAAVLTAVGAVSPGAVAIIAPIALGFAAQYGISPLLMGLLVIHGAQAGGFSPISIYGGITNGVVAKAGLPLNELATFGASFAVNFAVAMLLFFVLGGRRLLQQRAVASGPPPVVPHVDIAGPQTGMQAYGDAESEALSEEIAMETGQKVRPVSEAPAAGQMIGSRAYQILTLGGILLLAVLTLAFKLDIGFVAITIGLVLSLLAPNLQKRAIGQVTWPEIMLITGVSTYVFVLEKMGTIDFVGHSVAGLGSPLTGGPAAVPDRRGGLGLCLLDRGAGLADPAGGAVPAGRFRRRRHRLHRRHGRVLDHRRRQPVLDQRRPGPGQRPGDRPRRLFPQAADLRCHRDAGGAGRGLAAVRRPLVSFRATGYFVRLAVDRCSPGLTRPKFE